MTIDDARAYMEQYGAERLTAVAAAADEVRRMLPSLGYADAHENWRDTGLTFDPTRLVIDAPQGGKALAAALREKGIDADFDTVLKEVLERDHNDMTRAIAPLRQADDAVLLDNSDLDAAGTVKTALEIVRSKVSL